MLEQAKSALAKAEAATEAECGAGRGRECRALEKREDAALKQVADARAVLVGLGAEAVENPAGTTISALLGPWADLYQRVLQLAPAAWLELAAPVLLAYGFAPMARTAPAQHGASGTTAPRVPRVPTAPDGTVPTVPAPRARKRKRANGTVKRGSNSKAYITARLERAGRHDLVRAIRAGEMSAAMGAIKGGVRKQHLQVVSSK